VIKTNKQTNRPRSC